MREAPTLVKDGDLSATFHSVFGPRREVAFEVSKVKGHVGQAMVDEGDGRNEDRIDNDGAGTAADLGRLRQQDEVITARRALIRVRSHWYPMMLDLHKFMVVSILLEFTSFLATLQWPQGAADLGRFGISYLELLVMLELHSCHR